MPRLFTNFSGNYSLEQGSKVLAWFVYYKSIVGMHNGKIWPKAVLAKFNLHHSHFTCDTRKQAKYTQQNGNTAFDSQK